MKHSQAELPCLGPLHRLAQVDDGFGMSWNVMAAGLVPAVEMPCIGRPFPQADACLGMSCLPVNLLLGSVQLLWLVDG